MRRTNDPVTANNPKTTEDLEVVAAAIEDVNEARSSRWCTDRFHKLSPDERFAISLSLLVRMLATRSRPPVANDLPRQADHLATAGIHHQTRVQQEAASRALSHRP